MGLFNKWGHRRFRDLLSPYIDHRLDEAQAAVLEEHLVGCSSCQEELRTLRATTDLLHALPRAVPRQPIVLTAQPQIPPAVPRYLWGMRAATTAASLALVLLVAGDLLGTFSRDIPPTGEAIQSTSEKGAADTAPPLLGAESESAPGIVESGKAAPGADFAATSEAPLIQAKPQKKETLPVMALEIVLGSLLVMLALGTLFATLRNRRRAQLP